MNEANQKKANQKKAKRLNFTKAALSSLPLPKDTKRDTYHDAKESGLVVILTSKGAKSFYLYRKIQGKPERVFLGRFPDISVENARGLAAKAKGEIANGLNPQLERQNLRNDITFGEMFDEFMERYSKKHKKSWRYDEREVKKFLAHWFTKKASIISKQEVQRLHEKVRDNNGLYQANRILERIRAIYNKAIEWGWKGENPAIGVKKYQEKSRERFLQADEVARFMTALHNEPNRTMGDYILMSLFTGARKANVLSMSWNEIDFKACVWRIPETKNGEMVTVPLSQQALEVLNNRRKLADGEWVFPSASSKSGHISDPKRSWQRILKEANIENLRLHDLRRTLGSWQTATGANSYIIAKALGHKSQQSTAVYARLDLDPVRESVQMATDALLKASEQNDEN